MTAFYTWDVFPTLDGYGTYTDDVDWGGSWSKQGPELLEHRATLFDSAQRMVFGASTFRENAAIMASGNDPPTPIMSGTCGLGVCATVISSPLASRIPAGADRSHRARLE